MGRYYLIKSLVTWDQPSLLENTKKIFFFLIRIKQQDKCAIFINKYTSCQGCLNLILLSPEVIFLSRINIECVRTRGKIAGLVYMKKLNILLFAFANFFRAYRKLNCIWANFLVHGEKLLWNESQNEMIL